MDTFALMLQFRRIVIANSSFSWWAAFLSNADEVYYPRPVSGLWSLETPRINLAMDLPGWHRVEDVGVVTWQPFRRGSRSLKVKYHQAQPLESVNYVVQGNSLLLEVHPSSEALCSYLQARPAAFGLTDLPHFVASTGPQIARNILGACVKTGVLVVIPEDRDILRSEPFFRDVFEYAGRQ